MLNNSRLVKHYNQLQELYEDDNATNSDGSFGLSYILSSLENYLDSIESYPSHFSDVKGFDLYTKQNKEKAQELKTDYPHELSKTNFNTKIPTKFIIHGFVNSKEVKWMKIMKDQLLENSDMNVILVGWRSLLHYTIARDRVKVVAEKAAKLINHLKNRMDLKVEDVHLIGHSLGAHIAGLIGKKVKGIGRITGLDPAGPLFNFHDVTTRLYHKDAKFVDVIHTDAPMISFGGNGLLGFGTDFPCGHIDFYPNGGQRPQPGCNSLACSHMRAIDLFTESINSKTEFLAYQSATYDQFKEYEIKNTSFVMGLNATKPHKLPGSKYFLETAAKSPFCMSTQCNI